MKHLVFRYKNINLLLFNKIVIIAVYGNSRDQLIAIYMVNQQYKYCLVKAINVIA